MKQVLKNVIKRAFSELNNIFHDAFDKLLSLLLTNVWFFLSHNWWSSESNKKDKGPKQTHLAMLVSHVGFFCF